jgi:hypothetical protein
LTAPRAALTSKKPQVVRLVSRCCALGAVSILARPRPQPAKERRMPLPPLSPEDRQKALEKAAEARKKRAELKGQLKSGKMTLSEVLTTEGDDTVGKMKVSAVLEALPGVGKVRARKIMEKLDISATRRIKGLGPKQREALLAEFAKK